MNIGRNSYSVTGDIENADIGAFTSIAGGLTAHGDNNHAWVYNREFVSTFPFQEMMGIEGFPTSGGVKPKTQIGNDVWIGMSVNIMPGLVIGDGAIVGGHATVAKNVPPYAVVVGNPAKVVKYRFNREQREALLRIKWWEWEDKIVRERIEDFKDIKSFIKKYDTR